MVKIAHASINENGKISGGAPGDQTGREVCIRSWYSKPWNYVIRFKDPVKRKKVAECMIMAAHNPRIGYDQPRRNTLLDYARNVGYDPYKVTALCSTDCSALVTLVCIYAGIPESALVKGGNSATTRTLRKRLQATGEVVVYSSPDYTMKTDKLLTGDILLSEGHHVAGVVESDNKESSTQQDLTKVAQDVIRGRYGNGGQRRLALMAAGYDPAEVQAEVNRLLNR